jgi:hypothetical protein
MVAFGWVLIQSYVEIFWPQSTTVQWEGILGSEQHTGAFIAPSSGQP